MGIPYSKQINAAFDQVTPLVAAGFDVLETTKNISILLAAIQVVTVILQCVLLIMMGALLLSVNPDLEEERSAIVTPLLRYMSSFLMPGSHGRWILKVLGWSLLLSWIGACAAAVWYFSHDGSKALAIESEIPEGGVETAQGDDVDAIKSGQTSQ